MSPGDDDRFDGPPRSNGVATAAPVIGIIALCVGPLAGIPAIICGALGLSRSKHGVGQGAAVTGLVLGIISTVIMPFILVALLLPAVREAAGHSKDSNSLKHIAIAIRDDADFNRGRLMPAFAYDPDGEPIRRLSWRVGILRFLEQQDLYRRFKLDEAWDSPANRPLSQTVIQQYMSTSDPPSDLTRFRVFVGPGTLFEDTPEWRRTANLRRIPDGASVTAMAVESADTVPWASPQELTYQPGGPLPPLGHPNRSDVLVMMADGSVRTLKKSVSPSTWHALITRDGGEALPANWDQ